MGLDIRTAEFLLHCKNSGVNFVNSCTLGRQTVMLLPSERKKIYHWTGVQLKGCEFADIFLEYLGAAPPHSMDASTYEGADIIHNLNEKVPKHLENNFDCLIDGGTLEHIFEFTSALRSCLSMVRPGGHLIICNMANNHMGHGFYQFSPELFFSAFTPDNGCRLQSIFLNDGGTWYKPLDPNIVGRRLESRTGRCTTIFVCVQRISDDPPLANTPHQSDYRLTLPEGSGLGANTVAAHSQSLRQRLGVYFPNVKKMLYFWRKFKRGTLYGIIPFYEELDGRWNRFKGYCYRSLSNRANFIKIGRRLPLSW
jgi:hypothetical protein